jgi:hypothetical protein
MGTSTRSRKMPGAFIAGTVASAAVMTDLEPMVKWTAAIIAGGGVAGFTSDHRCFGQSPPSSPAALPTRSSPLRGVSLGVGQILGLGQIMLSVRLAIGRFGPEFEPATCKSLGVAFEAAWQKLLVSDSALASSSYADATREALAMHIIDLAQRGEHDVIRLRDESIAFVMRAIPQEQWRQGAE